MTVFDLLFILFFLATVGALVAAATFAVRRQYHRAGRILIRLITGAAVYFTVVIAVSLIAPRQSLKLGDRQCFDDMCVSVENFETLPEPGGVKYAVGVRLFNGGRGRAQREKDLVVYLTDDQGRRYDFVAGDADTPFDIRLEAGESALIGRSFFVPNDAKGIGAVITHEAGFPIRWLIIGYDTWFRKPPRVPLDAAALPYNMRLTYTRRPEINEILFNTILIAPRPRTRTRETNHVENQRRSAQFHC
jgi:hypothetical protein